MLFIHAGTPKTGTTYIQKIMHQNRELFMRHGIYYLPVDDFSLSLPRYANATFLYDASMGEDARKTIASRQSTHFLVSEEGIFGNADHLRHAAFDGVPKKIILYVRPAADFLSAWAAEFSNPYNVARSADFTDYHPTGRRILPFPQALAVASHEYAISLGRFMNVVQELGPEHFIVRPYERSTFVSQDLLTDFLSTLGLDAQVIRDDPTFQDADKINVSHSRKFCDVSCAVWHGFGEPDDLSHYNYDSVTEIMGQCRSGDSRSAIETLTDQEIDWLNLRFRHFESYLSRTFNNGVAFFKHNRPSFYGTDRAPLRPVDRQEIDLLVQLYQLRTKS